MKKIVLSLVMLLAVAALSAQNAGSKNNVKESVDEPTFITVEQMPEFPGGQEGLVNYLVENLNYPEKAKAEKITGKVYVSFVVEKDGSISNVKVLRDIGYGCGEEAVRVVKAMPRWKPGMQRGKNVRVQYTLPLNFQL
ncbi:MAG: energy transducer TonB [Bacteroidales bacterium]|nr:energy transducer TonB [Bacteroidales bacterium]MBP5759598.1 energy transducer TonB [Bacteroidales bacterium]